MAQPTLTKFYLPFGQAAGSVRQMDYTVAASQNIRRGDVVALNAGVIQQAIALPGTNNTATASGGNLPILGVAAADIITDAAGVSTDGQGRTTIPVQPFDDNFEYALRLWNATPANTTQPNVTVGTSYQFARFRGSSANEWFYVLTTTTTNGEFRVVSRNPASQPTDQYGILNVKAVLNATVRQTQ